MTIREFINSLYWPILFITQVDTNESGASIERVRVKYILEDGQETKILSRSSIITLLEHEIPIFTAGGELTRIGGTKDVHFAEVQIFPRKGRKYIKTKPNDTPCDNLGELPPIS